MVRSYGRVSSPCQTVTISLAQSPPHPGLFNLCYHTGWIPVFQVYPVCIVVEMRAAWQLACVMTAHSMDSAMHYYGGQTDYKSLAAFLLRNPLSVLSIVCVVHILCWELQAADGSILKFEHVIAHCGVLWCRLCVLVMAEHWHWYIRTKCFSFLSHNLRWFQFCDNLLVIWWTFPVGMHVRASKQTEWLGLCLFSIIQLCSLLYYTNIARSWHPLKHWQSGS